MKKLLNILAFSFMFIIFLGALTACGDASNDDNGSEGLFTSGTFEGVGSGYLGDITVEVTFSSTDILDIVIVDHSDTDGFADNAFDAIIPSILQAQSTNIDAVSGATYSANGVLEAVSDAIRQAGGNPDVLIPIVADIEAPVNTEADVIVVGGGLSGLAAAVTAAENGDSVILIEKMSVIGGSSALAWGGIGASETHLQAEADLEFTSEDFIQDWILAQENSLTDVDSFSAERVATIVNNSADQIEWLYEMGFEFADVTGRSHGPAAGMSGAHTTNFLAERLEALGGEIHTNTRGMDLIIDESGAVIGVTAEGPSGEISYMASNGVILATGGFSLNSELTDRFVPQATEFIPHSVVAPGSMGDGILMAEAVGAVAFEDSWMIGFGLTSPGDVPTPHSLFLPGTHVLVNQEGNRFTNERAGFAVNYNEALMYSPGGSIMIIDSSEAFAEIRPESADNVYVFTADTLEELAEMLGIDAQNLEEAIAHVNAVYADGEADLFGRDEEFSLPITQAPFYGIRYFPFDMGTMGGVVVDENYQVLDENNTPISGLFAIGEMSNRPYWGQIYVGGTSLLNAISGGRIAGSRVSE